jgi:lipopolysaccharide/colanic/teichoic acid biosynthesis glycosyltransferase
MNDPWTLIEIGTLAGCSMMRVTPVMSAPVRASHVRSLAPTLKRSVDFVGVLLLLLILFPIMLLFAVILRMDGGPALDGDTCIGHNGRPFKCLKFRTAAFGADGVPVANVQVAARRDHTGALTRDPRITRTGAFLLATGLAELPQLLNVLRGDMTLIGPDRRG